MTTTCPATTPGKPRTPTTSFSAQSQSEEEELPEPVIDEEWNASRGEYETVVTFACGSKYAIRQNSDDNWEVNGPGGFYVDFQTLEQALNYLTDDEFARGA